MNEEVKKILNNINYKYKDYYVQDIVSGDDLKLLLDYINNLQEENERLKELCDKYEEEHNTAFKLWKMKMEEMPTYIKY